MESEKLLFMAIFYALYVALRPLTGIAAELRVHVYSGTRVPVSGNFYAYPGYLVYRYPGTLERQQAEGIALLYRVGPRYEYLSGIPGTLFMVPFTVHVYPGRWTGRPQQPRCRVLQRYPGTRYRGTRVPGPGVTGYPVWSPGTRVPRKSCCKSHYAYWAYCYCGLVADICITIMYPGTRVGRNSYTEPTYVLPRLCPSQMEPTRGYKVMHVAVVPRVPGTGASLSKSDEFENAVCLLFETLPEGRTQKTSLQVDEVGHLCFVQGKGVVKTGHGCSDKKPSPCETTDLGIPSYV
eukprot:2435958-Rhodomonas_salina.2